MKTIEISTGIRLTATNATIERYLREVREEQELRKTIAWLATPEARECPEYSDIFKDVYGFRPRW
jgi:hypothetical protein